MGTNVSAWSLISQEPRFPHGVLSDSFVQRFDTFMDWELLSLHYIFTIEMLRMYFHRVNWFHVLKRQRFSEEILVEMIPTFNNCCWKEICKYQNLSESFIENYKDHLDWNLIFEHQQTRGIFLKEHGQYLPFMNFSDYNGSDYDEECSTPPLQSEVYTITPNLCNETKHNQSTPSVRNNSINLRPDHKSKQEHSTPPSSGTLFITPHLHLICILGLVFANVII